MLKAVELPGSVAHLDASLSNVDADHFPLRISIILCYRSYSLVLQGGTKKIMVSLSQIGSLLVQKPP